MNSMKFVKIAEVMTSYNFEFKGFSDNLKCAKCKLMLKDACHLPCGCTYCRVCIDDMIAKGGECCPGLSEDCSDTCLSTAAADYRTNNIISKLTVKCPNNGCMHQCELANIEEHLRECEKKSVECPFRELGCMQDQLAAEVMDGHLQKENRGHSEMLIGVIAKMNTEMESFRKQIKMLELELEMKDQQINNSIKKIDGEIAEMREKLDGARLSEHLDKEITSIKEVMESNKDESRNEMNSVLGDIQSIKNEICAMKPQRQSLQELVGQGEVDATFEWFIDDVWKTRWTDTTSEAFSGKKHQYKFQLIQMNCGVIGDVLRIYLRGVAGANDGNIMWPFTGRVVISVADKDKRETYKTISRECRIERIYAGSTYYYSCSDYFVFRYSELIEAGLDLSHGLCVLCQVVPGIAA